MRSVERGALEGSSLFSLREGESGRETERETEMERVSENVWEREYVRSPI